MRVKIFEDFWNFQISSNDDYRTHGAFEMLRIPRHERLLIVPLQVREDGSRLRRNPCVRPH